MTAARVAGRASSRGQWGLLVFLLLVVGVAIGVLALAVRGSTGSQEPYSLRSAAPSGLLGLRLWLEDMGYRVEFGASPETSDAEVVFLFPGQGKSYTELGSDLYREEALFREEVDRCCRALAPLLGTDLREMMFSKDDRVNQQIYRPLFWQPALFVVEYALAKLLMSILGWRSTVAE